MGVGLADDQHEWGSEMVIDQWTVEMWKVLMRENPLSQEKQVLLKVDLRVVIKPSVDGSSYLWQLVIETNDIMATKAFCRWKQFFFQASVGLEKESHPSEECGAK